MEPELSLIIVNYNGLNYLQACLDSLADKLSGIRHEIVIVDNNSTDNSTTFIAHNYPGIVLVKSSQNLGFGKGNNEGVKRAAGEYILLINNDTIVLDNLAPVLEVLKSDETIGALGINMLNGNREYLVPGGRFPSFRNMLEIKQVALGLGDEFRNGRFEKDKYEIDWLGGAFLMMRKKIFLEMGGFDKDYFMYVEDVDFSKKLADKGYKRVFLPDYSYIHFVGFTTAKNPLLIKGYRTYIKKHFHGLKKQLLLFALKLNEIVKVIKQGRKAGTL